MKLAWFPLPEHGGVAIKGEAVRMLWDRSRTGVLAAKDCRKCRGSGIADPFTRNPKPCKCVLRKIFTVCHDRYQTIGHEQAAMGTSSHFMHTGNGRITYRRRTRGWSRPKEEFRADFVGIARRALTALEFRLFALHFLELRAWTWCAPRLRLNRGNFFHAVYLVEAKLGLAFAEARPFALFPLDEYLNGTGSGSPRRIASGALPGKLTQEAEPGMPRAIAPPDRPEPGPWPPPYDEEPLAMTMAAAAA